MIPSKTTDRLSSTSAPTGAITFWYRNYRGEEGYRRARPINIRFGTTEWNKEPQWLMLEDHIVNGKCREFAMKDMTSVVGGPAFAIDPAWDALPWERNAAEKATGIS